jgi:putative copper resistance protein D
MAWFGADIDAPMVAVRAVHFAATATTAGVLLFRAVVADPALQAAEQIERVIDARIRALAWAGFAIALVSGILWLLLQTSAMSGQAFGEVIQSGAIVTVVDDTQFGLLSEIRLALAVLLAICLAFDRQRLPRWLALGSALCLVAAIAWTGHAASTPFKLGYLHVAADALHCCGAAAWIGGLMSLALLIRIVGRYHASAGAAMRLDAVRRFSTLGMASVATLAVSGMINAWILVGSVRALFLTDYGQILMLKVGAFIAMLALAAANRFWLTPRLAEPEGGAPRYLMRNTVAEIVLALFVFALVGLLGTMHPAAHLVK